MRRRGWMLGMTHSRTRRTARSRTRAISPMKPAADALPLDTTDLNADEAFEAARALIGPVFDRA